MRDVLKTQINANTILILAVGALVTVGVHKITDTFSSVERFQVELQGLTQRMDRQEQRLDRFVEEFDGGARIHALSPKDATNANRP